MTTQIYDRSGPHSNYAGYGNPLRKHHKPSHERPLLIAFTGKLGSGKTSAAAYINKKYGGVNLPFARPLKIEVYNYLGGSEMLPATWFGDPNNIDATWIAAAQALHMHISPKLILPTDNEKVELINKNKAQLRPLLQWWGTNYRRATDENYWINQTIAAVEKARNDGTYVITVDDMRFRNEAEALANIGFNIVKLTTGDSECVVRVGIRDSITIDPGDAHASELETDALAAHHYLENSHEEHMMNRHLDNIVLQILNQE